MSLKIIVNGAPCEAEARTLMDLWRKETEHLELESPKGFAIAHNGRLVRRDEWEQTYLGDGDKVEIVRALQGG